MINFLIAAVLTLVIIHFTFFNVFIDCAAFVFYCFVVQLHPGFYEYAKSLQIDINTAFHTILLLITTFLLFREKRNIKTNKSKKSD